MIARARLESRRRRTGALDAAGARLGSTGVSVAMASREMRAEPPWVKSVTRMRNLDGLRSPDAAWRRPHQSRSAHGRYTYVPEKRDGLLKWAEHLTGAATEGPTADETDIAAERRETLEAAKARSLAQCRDGLEAWITGFG